MGSCLPDERTWTWLGLNVAKLGVGLGLLVDGALDTGPAFLLVGLALGVALAALSVVKQIRTYL